MNQKDLVELLGEKRHQIISAELRSAIALALITVMAMTGFLTGEVLLRAHVSRPVSRHGRIVKRVESVCGHSRGTVRCQRPAGYQEPNSVPQNVRSSVFYLVHVRIFIEVFSLALLMRLALLPVQFPRVTGEDQNMLGSHGHKPLTGGICGPGWLLQRRQFLRRASLRWLVC